MFDNIKNGYGIFLKHIKSSHTPPPPPREKYIKPIPVQHIYQYSDRLSIFIMNTVHVLLFPGTLKTGR